MNGIDMNDHRQVVGNAFPTTTAGTVSQAFRWQPGQAPVALGTLGGPSGSEAVEINQAGSVLGYSTTPQNDQRMFLWRHGKMIDLGTLGGPNTRLGFGIVGRSDRLNEHDQVAGTSETASGDLHAFRWSHGNMRDLGTLGGATSYASGINDRGQVVGMSQRPNGDLSAFLWQHGRMTDLGALTDSTYSAASAINDRGQILGFRFKDFQFRTVLWVAR
jgi:probable HAF family extracellular repeat protein